MRILGVVVPSSRSGRRTLRFPAGAALLTQDPRKSVRCASGLKRHDCDARPEGPISAS